MGKQTHDELELMESSYGNIYEQPFSKELFKNYIPSII